MSHPLVGAALLLVLVVPIHSAGADRMTDEQVQGLIKDIDVAYDNWKEGLEKRNLDDSVITSPERTIDVKSFLTDFEKAIDVVRDRFKPDYAASPEVLALLRRGSDVELRNRRQERAPSSEWKAMASKLSALSGAYGVAWPVESMNVHAARLNDGELAARLEQMEQAVKRLQAEAEKAAKADKSIDKATRASLKASIQELARATQEVRSRIRDDRPASVEVELLLSQASSLKGMLTKLSLSPAAWQGIEAETQTLARIWNIGRP
jgi:hypothetical protein